MTPLLVGKDANLKCENKKSFILFLHSTKLCTACHFINASFTFSFEKIYD